VSKDPRSTRSGSLTVTATRKPDRSPSATCSPTRRRCTSRDPVGLEHAGFAVEHVEGFAADYTETLTHWLTRLEDRLEDAVRLAGEQRIRVWRIYLRAARSGFRTDFTSLYQVRAHPAYSLKNGGSYPHHGL
jgi:hypothetical protein